MNATPDLVKLHSMRDTVLPRKGIVGCGADFTVALHGIGRILHAGSDRFGEREVQAFMGVISVLAGAHSAVTLHEDGTVRTVGRSASERAFSDTVISARGIACGARHIAVLCGNGRLLVGGEEHRGIAEISEWPPVVDMACGRRFTAGLTDEGTVLLAGGSPFMNHTVESWQGIVSLFADSEGDELYAISEEGRILSTARLPRAVRKWREIVYMAVSGEHFRAVTAAGRLLSNDPLPKEADPNQVYVSCAVSTEHTVAVTQNGTVFATGRDDFGQCRTARFGHLFSYFEEYSRMRSDKLAKLEIAEYRRFSRAADVARFGDRLLCTEHVTAAITAYGSVLTAYGFGTCRSSWSHVRRLAAGNSHILALHINGRVSADGNDVSGCCQVSDWSDIRAITAANYHSIGVTEDGRVRYSGLNDKGQGDVADWTNIRMIRTTATYTVGVTYDGHIRIAGHPPFDPHDIDDRWSHPEDVVTTATHMVCRYADGTVRSTLRHTDSVLSRDFVMAAWTQVSDIAAGCGFTVALRYGGTVYACGEDRLGQCRTEAWRDVVSIMCGDTYTVGLTADGRVLTAGDFRPTVFDAPSASVDHPPEAARNGTPLTDARLWQDILALACSPVHIIGLDRSGQVFACGSNEDNRCSGTAHFVLFRDAGRIGDDTHNHSEDDAADELPDLSDD